MKQFNRYGPMIRSKVYGDGAIIADLRRRLELAEHRVTRLEAREEDVIAKEWALQNREQELKKVVDEVNAATTLNIEREEALEALEARLCGMEAGLMARERACLAREESSRLREIASSLLDVEEAGKLVNEAVEWARKELADVREAHFCEVMRKGEEEGMPTFALAYALTAVILDECECSEWEDEDDN